MSVTGRNYGDIPYWVIDGGNRIISNGRRGFLGIIKKEMNLGCMMRQGSRLNM